MKSEFSESARTIWDLIWYPREEDVIGFRVFQMISIPIIMVLTIVLNIFVKSSTWIFLMLAWLLITILLWSVASIRFKIINPPKKEQKGL